MRPLAVDLFCGMGGWTIGLLAAGWRVIGFDIAADLTRDYPGHLALQDVATVSGYPMRGKVDLIVASPPCHGGYGGGFGWDCSPMRRNNSKSPARREASAQIAMIPFDLARWIGECFFHAQQESAS